jgi:hypothetical protein
MENSKLGLRKPTPKPFSFLRWLFKPEATHTDGGVYLGINGACLTLVQPMVARWYI